MPLFTQDAPGSRQRLPLVVSVCLFLGVSSSPGFAQTDSATETTDAAPAAPLPSQQKFTTKNFVVYTDLPDDEAQEVLDRLETTLARVSRYWGRRPAQQIECYVADDLKHWKDSDFPHGFARALIKGVGGGAYSELLADKRYRFGVTVYSSSRPGIVEHEAVHAYCGQTFGLTGPDWYKEGMAELAFHGRAGKMEVECDAKVIDYLQRSRRPSIRQITNAAHMNQDLSQSLMKLMSAGGSDTREQRNERIRQWCRNHGAAVQASRESYHWCWALCHFLSHNPNYAKRFRQLGRSYLTRIMRDHQELFHKLLGSMQREIEFEYKFFLDRIGVGYRVDLCHWDWNSKFRTIDAGESKSTRVEAAFGYQASGLNVRKNRAYSFQCSGTWQIEHEGSDIDADGNEQGQGRLEGVILSDYELSEPFDLGHSGSFKAPADGKLYLRCRDRWTELGDNDGSVLVKIAN